MRFPLWMGLALLAACASPASECESATDCNDNNACTDDVCSAGACANPATALDDGNPCTVDLCDPALGIIREPVEVDDGVACTFDECDAVFGVQHFPTDSLCDDGVACTVDACDPVNDCGSTPDNNACNESQFCDPDNDCQDIPTPVVDAIVPNNSLSGAPTAGVVIAGANFVAGAQVTLAGALVPVADCDYTNIPTEIVCTAPPVALAVRGDVVVENPGGLLGVLPSGWTYTAVNNESGAPEELDFCNVQFPLAITGAPGAPIDFFGQLFEDNVTNTSGAPFPGVFADLGVSPPDAAGVDLDPTQSTAWRFFPAVPNPGFNFAGNNDEYLASFSPPTAGVFRYVFRFSLNNGLSYTYCDTNGAGSNGGLDFSAADAGTLTAQ